MEEIHLVAAVAARIIDQYGSRSLDTITQHCEMANAIGDRPSLQTWRDIAVAVESLQSMPTVAHGTAKVTDSSDHQEPSRHLVLVEMSE